MVDQNSNINQQSTGSKKTNQMLRPFKTLMLEGNLQPSLENHYYYQALIRSAKNSSTLTVIQNDKNGLQRRKIEALVKEYDIPTLLVTDQRIPVDKPIKRQSYKTLEISLTKNNSPFEEFRLVILGEPKANMKYKALLAHVLELLDPTMNIFVEHPGIDNLRLLLDQTREKIKTLNVLAISETGHLPETIAIGFDRLITNQIDFGTYQALNQFSRRKNFNVDKVKEYLKKLGGIFHFEYLDHYSVLSEKEFTPLFLVKEWEEVTPDLDQKEERTDQPVSSPASKENTEFQNIDYTEVHKKLDDLKSVVGAVKKEVLGLHRGQRQTATSLELEPFHQHLENITEQLKSFTTEKDKLSDELLTKFTEFHDQANESLVKIMSKDIELALKPLIELLSAFNTKPDQLSEKDLDVLKTIKKELKALNTSRNEIKQLVELQESLREYLIEQEKEYSTSLTRIQETIEQPKNELALTTQTKEFGKTLIQEFFAEIVDDDTFQLAKSKNYLGDPDRIIPMDERMKERLGD